MEAAEAHGSVVVLPRHRVTALTTSGGTVTGAEGDVLMPSGAARGYASSRQVVGSFTITAGATIVASGGIGGNHDLVRANWPARLGTPPTTMVSGVPAYVDGSMLAVTEQAGARVINADRMWHYVEGIQNWDPVWPDHGIRILPGPSSVWLDATGRRLPVPLFPGFDTLGTLAHLRQTGHDHSWFVLSRQIIEKEFTLSGSEQNPDLTDRDIGLLLKSRLGKGAAGPVQAFMDKGADFVVRETLDDLIAGMRALPGGDALDAERVRIEIEARDREVDNDFTKDAQIAMLRSARAYRGDRLVRTATPHRILDPASGPLIAVKLHVLTRKSLGGIETDLSSRALGVDGQPVPGAVRGGRGQWLRRRRSPRLPRARGHLRRRMPVLGSCGGTGGRDRRVNRAIRRGTRHPERPSGAFARRSPTGAPDRRESRGHRTPHQDMPALQAHAGPGSAREDACRLCAADEPHAHRGECRTERQTADVLCLGAPDRGADRADDILSGIRRHRVGDPFDPRLGVGSENRSLDALAALPPGPRGRDAGPCRRQRGVGKQHRRGVIGGGREGGCRHHEVAHQIGVGCERAQRQHGGRGIPDSARCEGRCGHGHDAARRLQPDPFVGEALRSAGEGEGVRGGLGVGEQQARGHRL